MKIGCLQFAPAVGEVDNNLNRADEILDRADPERLDLLVLPELAFSGYNFKSLSDITKHLEHSGSGISSLWARSQALRYDCAVIVGYPEEVDLSTSWPANPEYYNSAVVVNYEGETVGNYRKSHLYYTDETWALEGDGFFAQPILGLGGTALGICMDINPYKFEAPWNKFEFANHVLESGVKLVVLSMAWITQEDPAEFTRTPKEPDMNTLSYWISRLQPIIQAQADEETIVVFANRTGTEGDVTYAGTSAVVGIKSGEIKVYGLLGRGEKELLVVDTEGPPFARLSYRPDFLNIGEPRSTDILQPQAPVPAPNGPVDVEQRSSAASSSGHGSNERGTHKNRGRDRRPRPETEDLIDLSDPPLNSNHHQGSTAQQYAGAQQMAPNDDASQFLDDEPLILDPQATARRLGLIRNPSPTGSDEQADGSSGRHSSQQRWNAQKAQEPKQKPSQYNPVDDDEDTVPAFGTLNVEDTKRRSLRSDIAVYDPRVASRQKPAAPTAQETHLRSKLHPTDRGAEDANSRNGSRNTNHTRPGAHRSSAQNDRRIDELGRSSSSALPKKDILAARERFEEFARRSESAQGNLPSQGNNLASQGNLPSQGNLASRGNLTSSQNSKSSGMDVESWIRESQAATYGLAKLASNPTPVQDKPDPRENTPNPNLVERPYHTDRKDRTNSRTTGRPIVQPAPLSRVDPGAKQQSDIRALPAKKPAQKPNTFIDRPQSARPPSQTRDKRAESRDRPRSTRPQETKVPASTEIQRPYSNLPIVGTLDVSKGEVDLSQFALIEEYPNPRSRSRAKHKSQSRHRNQQSREARNTPSHQGHRPRHSTQNVSTPTPQKPQPRTRAPSNTSTPVMKPLRTTDLSQRTKHGPSASVDTMASTNSTHSPDMEPKTPVAMVLVPDLGSQVMLQPLKCVERGAEGRGERMSTVW